MSFGGADVFTDLPTPDEIRAARRARHLTLAEFGREVGRYRLRVRWGRTESVPFSRQAIEAIEKSRISVSRIFAQALRQWQGQIPPDLKFIAGVHSLIDLPPDAIVCGLALVICRVCGRKLVAYPWTKYCPAAINPECRKEARRRRANSTADHIS